LGCKNFARRAALVLAAAKEYRDFGSKAMSVEELRRGAVGCRRCNNREKP
jgi:hypothetical protein